MRQRRELIIILVAAICALCGCQTNSAGRAGYVPTNCSQPGASCSLDPPALSEAARR
jgi:tRNA(Ile2) C34 agmatinyltransferase TiaS